MKHLVVTIFGLLFSPGASAAIESTFAEDLDKKWQSSVHFHYVNYEYDEPGVMKISGPMAGVGLGTDYLLNHSVSLLRFNAQFASGETTYEGSTFSGRPVTSKNNDYFYNLKSLYVYKLDLNEYGTSANVGTGLGYRYLKNDNRSRDREQKYLYLPLHMGWSRNLATGLKLNLELAYNIVLNAETVAHWEQVDSRLQSVTYDQSGGTGTRLSAMLDHEVGDAEFRYGVTYAQWDFPDSSIETLRMKNGVAVTHENSGQEFRLVEPKNSTTTVALSLGVLF